MIGSISNPGTSAIRQMPPRAACSFAPAAGGGEPVDSVKLGGAQPPRAQWGWKGHTLVHSEAMHGLPEGMPEFFTKAADRVTALASQPDRWKIGSLPHLRDTSRPDHWLSFEALSGHELPGDRYEYVLMVDEAQLAGPGRPPQLLGTLPYRVAEMYQQLVAEFALWRNEFDRSGAQDTQTLQYQENVIYTAGILGHYIGDAAQPLHASIHFDRWNDARAPNPEGYRTRPGLHREFETLLVNRVVDEDDVRRRIGPPRRLEGDPLNWGMEMVRESNSQVERLYELEKRGQLSPIWPGSEGIDFAVGRVAKGAENLRNLFYSAWLDSADVAENIRDHDPEEDFPPYLFAP